MGSRRHAATIGTVVDPLIGPAELEKLQRETFGYFLKDVTEDPCGFEATFNPTHRDRSKIRFGGVSPWQFGLNQGPIVLTIENYRSGLPWRLMRSCPHATVALRLEGETRRMSHPVPVGYSCDRNMRFGLDADFRLDPEHPATA
jgi:hypothetical protein